MAEHPFPHGKLLQWFKREARPLPWRESYDPYEVLISEMMLQQTQIVTALPYFLRWTKRWPNWTALAKAKEEQVLKEWEGLGYYQRARRLLALATVVCDRHGGSLPKSESELLELPGIGPYTAAAVSAIAFNQSAFPIDGNVRRVLSRFLKDEQWSPSPQQDQSLKDLMLPSFQRTRQKRELAQAMMELGALVCSPKKPQCSTCPLQSDCACAEANTALDYPKKKPKAKAKELHLNYLWLISKRGVALRQRSNQGRFPSQWEPLSAETSKEKSSQRELQHIVGVKTIPWEKAFRRDFTTFHVTWQEGYVADLKGIDLTDHQWIPLEEVKSLNLVPVMAKTWDLQRARDLQAGLA